MSPLRIVAVAAPLLVLAAGCLPDPSGEFDDFNAKTKIVDAGPVDSGPPGTAFTEAFQGEYFAICKTSISPTAKNSLRFSVTTTYAPPGTASGSLKMVFHPLTAKKTTFAAADIVGSPIDLPESPVDKEGVANASTKATFDIPGIANPITGSAIQAEGLTIAAKVKAKEKFCADFSTKLIKPYTSDVTAECLFLNLAEGAAIPEFTDDEVNCP
jgi:hypothetical protein